MVHSITTVLFCYWSVESEIGGSDFTVESVVRDNSILFIRTLSTVFTLGSIIVATTGDWGTGTKLCGFGTVGNTGTELIRVLLVLLVLLLSGVVEAAGNRRIYSYIFIIYNIKSKYNS